MDKQMIDDAWVFGLSRERAPIVVEDLFLLHLGMVHQSIKQHIEASKERGDEMRQCYVEGMERGLRMAYEAYSSLIKDEAEEEQLKKAKGSYSFTPYP